ncbi:hypothetical protein DRP77_07520 [Candidatus Poribacteria bacterium]|nr:MAG: hypothetical protein DRP77_07520 [Candidatus Poribacteria bacterium]
MARVFFPQFKRGKDGVEVALNSTILEHARRLGVEISSECGGRGICGRCVVRIARGAEALSPLTEAEREHGLSGGERLACQARVVKPADIIVYVREVGKLSILSETMEDRVRLDPFVVRRGEEVVWRGPCGEEVLDRYRGGIYGLAIDVGTTTVVFQIVDLEGGEVVETVAFKNPQAAYGDDVISRISYAMYNEGGLRELQRAVLEAVNERLNEGLRDLIYEAVVVGNSTMRSIFFGVDVTTLGVLPFEPLIKGPLNVKASKLGLRVNPNANVYGAGLIGGHAGADALADIIASEIYKSDKPCMIVDIGTNGEVIVGNRDRMFSASCAAGGAYEGAAVSCGVGAVEGAIKSVRIVGGRAVYETIGGKPPIGICGSGLIDLLAEMLRNGIIDERGRFTSPERRFAVDEGRGIVITQEDVNQLLLARSGMSLDQRFLMKLFGTTVDELDRIFIAGAFGNYIDEENAMFIGLLPEARGKVVKMGNGALAGARQMLISREKRREAEELIGRIRHVKPNEEDPEFFDKFVEGLRFGSWRV